MPKAKPSFWFDHIATEMKHPTKLRIILRSWSLQEARKECVIAKASNKHWRLKKHLKIGAFIISQHLPNATWICVFIPAVEKKRKIEIVPNYKHSLKAFCRRVWTFFNFGLYFYTFLIPLTEAKSLTRIL